MKKKWVLAAVSAMLLMGGCAPALQNNDEVIQGDGEEKTSVIPTYQISDSYYRTIVPFEPGKARGLVVSNLNTRYDIAEFETGLMRIAQKNFSPEQFFFQEGQVLDEDVIRSWLSRKYTDAQLKENELTAKENLGLNPIDTGEGSVDERNERAPIYLAHIMEQDYLTKKEDNSLQLDGMVIGLALNSVHYYQKEEYGAQYEFKMDDETVEREGKKIAAEVASRLRAMDKTKNIPITIALFKQAPQNSVTAGNFIAYTHLDAGDADTSDWKAVNEKYVLFPSSSAEEDHREDSTYFANFKQDIESYFDGTNGVIGRGLYSGEELTSLKIEIPIQFYGKAEAIGFTQYVTGLVMEHFPAYIPIEVSITSTGGPEALIVKEANAKEPYVHVYE
ncbi:CamS family sex pheromone protein [Domibacillus sp.]|uniref:CamS family sex pheromone protein n=1 Tax=Domibacillus sp. TaxID=1969783 RepID=UPI002811D553|nr:CamS family sex pheromone protein [Domibacillus sp.]